MIFNMLERAIQLGDYSPFSWDPSRLYTPGGSRGDHDRSRANFLAPLGCSHDASRVSDPTTVPSASNYADVGRDGSAAFRIGKPNTSDRIAAGRNRAR